MRLHRLASALILLACLDRDCLAAEEQGGLTLAELQAAALEQHPALKQAQMKIEAARGKWLQAGLYPNPVAGYEGDEIGDEHSAGKQGAFFAQELVTAGKLRLNRAVVSHEVQQAQHEWAAQRQRVLNDVATAYCDLLAAQRGWELAGQLARIGEESLEAAERLLDAKQVSRVDVLAARIETASARLRRASAENRYRAAWRRLAAALGQPTMQPAGVAGKLDDDLPQLTWEDALQHLVAKSPELARARSAVERARCAVARQCAGRIPNVNLAAGVHHDNVSGDNIARVEIGLPLPLFNRNQGNIARAQAELVAAQHEVQRVELDLHDRLAAAFQRYQDARREVETYRASILPDAQASLELVSTAYRQGEVGYVTLLTAQRTYFSANLAYLESLRQLRTTAVAIEGLLLGGSPGETRRAPLGIETEEGQAGGAPDLK
jgi:cobalt-zinc-cadmium efflux system outer membrane protein